MPHSIETLRQKKRKKVSSSDLYEDLLSKCELEISKWETSFRSPLLDWNLLCFSTRWASCKRGESWGLERGPSAARVDGVWEVWSTLWDGLGQDLASGLWRHPLSYRSGDADWGPRRWRAKGTFSGDARLCLGMCSRPLRLGTRQRWRWCVSSNELWSNQRDWQNAQWLSPMATHFVLHNTALRCRCTHAHTHVHMCTHMHAHTHAHVHAHTRAHAHMYMLTHVHTMHAHTHARTHTHMCTHMHIHTHVCARTHTPLPANISTLHRHSSQIWSRGYLLTTYNCTKQPWLKYQNPVKIHSKGLNTNLYF